MNGHAVEVKAEICILGKEHECELTTLDAVFSSSRYVVFYLTSSKNGRSHELVAPLRRLVHERNENGGKNAKE